MTGGALPGQHSVLPVDRKSSDPGMVERCLIERPQLAVGTRVLDMTGHALSLGILVYPRLFRNAVSHRLMTRQAFDRRHLLSSFVALLAIRNPFEGAVRPRQRPWRQERTELRIGPPVSRQDGRQGKQGTSQHARYHLNGTYPKYIVTPTCATTMTSCT